MKRTVDRTGVCLAAWVAAALLFTACAKAPKETEEKAAPFSIRGTVLDAGRKPVAGAEVTLLRPSRGGILGKATTSEQGRFVIEAEGIPEGSRLIVRGGSFAPSFLDDLPAIPGEGDVGPILLYPPVRLRGRVSDGEEKPIPGAAISVLPLSETFQGEVTRRALATTGEDGTFEIASLPPGKVTVGGRAEGYADLVLPETPLLAGAENAVLLKMSPEVPLEGFVVDESGAPVAGARISANRGGAPAAIWREPVETDSRGRFRIAGLDRVDASLGIRITKGARGSATFEGSALPPDGRYALKTGPLVELRTERAGGGTAPAIRGIRYEVFTRSGEGWKRQDGEVGPDEREAPESNLWRFGLPGGGNVRFSVTAEDGSVAQHGPVEVAGTTPRPFEVRVSFEKPGSLRGRVVRADRTPIPGLLVRLSGGNEGISSRAVRSGADGSFRFEDVPPGEWRLEARSSEWIAEAMSMTVAAGGRNEGIELVARKSSRVAGLLTFGGAPPGEEVPISAFRFEGRRSGGLPGGREDTGQWKLVALGPSNAAGEFSIAPLPAGRIALVPKRPLDSDHGGIRRFARETPETDYHSWKWKVRVPPEEKARLDLDLPAFLPSTLRGSVRVNGDPRSGWRVSLATSDGSVSRSETTDAGGRFRFRLDRGGEHEVRLSCGGVEESRKVEIRDGEDRDLDLDLACGSVEGTLLDLAGRPLALRVRLERPRAGGAERHPAYGPEDEETWASATEVLSDDAGAYSFPEIPAGTYRVFAYDVDGRQAVTASEPISVGGKDDIRLPPLRVPPEAPLRVTVKSPEGKPPFASVRVTAAPGVAPLPRPFFVWMADGSTVVRGLPPGPVVAHLHVYGPWSAPDQTVTLPGDGSETAIVFEVAKKE